MNFRIVIIPISSIALALALISGSCGNSGNEKTESVNQETTAKSNPADSVAGRTIADQNAATRQETTPPAAETGASKNDFKPSAAVKTVPKPETNKPAEQTPKPDPGAAKVTAEQPPTNPVSPPKAVVTEKQEPKVTAQPQPVPQPVAEKPREVVVTQPAKTTEPDPGNWVVPAKDKNKSNPVKADAESLGAGKSLYVKHCAACHGKTGRGDGSKAAQLKTECGNFTLPAFQNQSDGSLFYKIREGKGDMPGFKKKLPDEEDIWSIINYVRTLKHG